MRATGIVRRIDDLGRINIPKEIRRQVFGTQDADGEPMEIFMDGESIVLKRYETEEIRKEKEIRNKAIDETVKRFKDWMLENDGLSEKDIREIDEIAEHMKGGE